MHERYHYSVSTERALKRSGEGVPPLRGRCAATPDHAVFICRGIGGAHYIHTAFVPDFFRTLPRSAAGSFATMSMPPPIGVPGIEPGKGIIGARLVTLIVYINTGGNPDVRDNDLFEIDAAGFLVDMGSVLADHCSHAASAASRPALQRAIRRLKPGDTLVIARLGYLGSSISDTVSTLATLAARRAHAICLDAGKTDLCASGDDSPIRMLQLAAELERDAKRARALEAAAIAKKVGTQQGRPASLSDSQRQQALKALASGSTVTAIARVLSTSRQTIIRLRDAASREAAGVQAPPLEH